MKVLSEHQHKVADYIHHHYENVQVLVQDSWMRLDFNKDGHVSMEDLKKGVHDLYEFMLSYDYFQKATEIKSKLYSEAIKFMQKDLQHERSHQESHIDENDEKVESQLMD